MKQQFDMFIEEPIMRLAKRRAIEEGRSVSDLIQDAIEHTTVPTLKS